MSASSSMGDTLAWRRFVAVAFAAAFCLYCAIVAATYVIDPFGEAPRARGAYFASDVPTIARYRTMLSEASYTLVFGTSRSHLLSDDILGEPVLNLFPLYGSPVSVDHFLRGLDQRQLGNIRRVIYLLDVHTFSKAGPFVMDYYSEPLANLKYRVLNFPMYVSRSLERLRKNRKRDMAGYVHWRGFLVPGRVVRWDGSSISVNAQDFDPSIIGRLGEIKQFLDERNIAVEFVTPTVTAAHLRALDIGKLVALRRAILAEIGTYAELTYMPGISSSKELFSDDSHLNTEGVRELFSRYPWADRRVVASGAQLLFNQLEAVHEGRLSESK
jgi:hypothetical protein